MKRLIVSIILAGTLLLAGTAIASSLTAVRPQPVPLNGSSSTTTESLCIEGYLPDGRWFECP